MKTSKRKRSKRKPLVGSAELTPYQLRHQEMGMGENTFRNRNEPVWPSGKARFKHIKGSKERLFIGTQTHNLLMFGVIPFVKPQNDT